MQRKRVLNEGDARRLLPHFLHILHRARSNPTWGERTRPNIRFSREQLWGPVGVPGTEVL